MIGAGFDQQTTKEKALLEKALEQLEEIARTKVRKIDWKVLHRDAQADARVKFEPPLKRQWIEIRGELTPARLGPILAAIKRLPQPNLLVTPYVTPPMALRLRQAGVQFLDAEGNAYLDQDDPRIFIWVTGNRPAKPKVGEKTLKVFHTAGLRVVFPLLCLPETEIERVTYRDLAKWAGVALGTVAKTMKELQYLGYLRKRKAHLVLENKARLMEAWVDAYPRELRPLLEPRRFRTDKAEWWNDADWPHWGAWLGGEPAAALMTKHLRPQNATVYLAGGNAEIAKALRLAKEDQGNVELTKKFWFFDWESNRQTRLVPPLLVYADLVGTGEDRNLETAEIIMERYLG